MSTQEATKPESERTPRRPRRLKVWVGVGIFLALWAAALFALHILNTPAQGIVIERPTQDTSHSSKQLITLKGKTATFQYSAQLQRVKSDSLAVGDIEKFLFKNPQHGDWSLAIRIKKLSGGMLANDGNYNLRKQNPHQYVEQTRIINDETVSIMTDHSGMYNQVAFLPHGEFVTEVSLSGAETGDADSQAIFDTVLNSWQWL